MIRVRIHDNDINHNNKDPQESVHKTYPSSIPTERLGEGCLMKENGHVLRQQYLSLNDSVNVHHLRL